MPAARAGAWESGLSHAQRATRLYRASLRNSRDWSIDYEIWVLDSRKIQARFAANRDKSPAEGRDLVAAGMAELLEKRHPDPYIPSYAEGSSKFQRNVPPPPEVRAFLLLTKLWGLLAFVALFTNSRLFVFLYRCAQLTEYSMPSPENAIK